MATSWLEHCICGVSDRIVAVHRAKDENLSEINSTPQAREADLIEFHKGLAAIPDHTDECWQHYESCQQGDD